MVVTAGCEPWRACDLPVLSQCVGAWPAKACARSWWPEALTEEQYQDTSGERAAPGATVAGAGRASGVTPSTTVIPRAATTRPS